MKRLFLLTVAVLIGIAVNAQSQQMAVLNHDGEYSTFYGSGALESAADAAVDGDKITLSPGYFTSWNNISKSLTIIGAGMTGSLDEVTRVQCLRFLNNPSTKSKVENVNIVEYIAAIGVDSITLVKCSIKNMHGGGNVVNLTNCEVLDMGSNSGGWDFATTNIINSVISGYNGFMRMKGTNTFINSALCGPAGSGVYKNCIFFANNGRWLGSENSVKNCKYIGDISNFFEKVGDDGNECVPADAQVFVEGSLYELTPEYAAKWIDSEDGSQIGLYGGPAPFTSVPSNPHISKFDVASKTTADGKLTIDIEVNAPTR